MIGDEVPTTTHHQPQTTNRKLLLRAAAATSSADRQPFVDQFLLANLCALDDVHYAVIRIVALKFEDTGRNTRDVRLDRPRPRPCVRVVERVLVLDRGRVHEREAL